MSKVRMGLPESEVQISSSELVVYAVSLRSEVRVGVGRSVIQVGGRLGPWSGRTSF